MHFKSSINRSPRKATPGLPGEERALKLELKLLADVGLLGFPNAGKSTFIRAVSAATPKVADYPFTTLYPNLGVVSVEPHRSFVIADIPGPDRRRGGRRRAWAAQFLRHVQRTRLLLHLVDIAPMEGGVEGVDPADQVRAIERELDKYDPELLDKPRWLVLNKADLLLEEEQQAAAQAVVDELGWKEPLVPGLGHRPRRHLADHARRAWRSSTASAKTRWKPRAKARAMRRTEAVARATKNPASAGFLFAASNVTAWSRRQARLWSAVPWTPVRRCAVSGGLAGP